MWCNWKVYKFYAYIQVPMYICGCLLCTCISGLYLNSDTPSNCFLRLFLLGIFNFCGTITMARVRPKIHPIDIASGLRIGTLALNPMHVVISASTQYGSLLALDIPTDISCIVGKRTLKH